jgi:hypothetical protein
MLLYTVGLQSGDPSRVFLATPRSARFRVPRSRQSEMLGQNHQVSRRERRIAENCSNFGTTWFESQLTTAGWRNTNSAATAPKSPIRRVRAQ